MAKKDFGGTLVTDAQLYDARRAELIARADAWKARVKLLLDFHGLDGR